MKKFITVIILSSILSFTGCNNNPENVVPPNNQITTTQPNEQTAIPSLQEITTQQAKKIAFKDANISENDLTMIEIKLDDENHYDIQFKADNIKYHYEISKKNGSILSYKKEQSKPVQPKTKQPKSEQPKITKPKTNTKTIKNKTYISKEKAKQIALKHANVSEKDIFDFEIEFDRANQYDYDKSDKYDHYEISFQKGKVDFDYDINAITGKIISHHKEID